MENIGNDNNYEDVTSQDSSDESLYYSVSGSTVLPSDEEFDSYSYLSESDSASVYSGSYEPDIGQVNPTFYPALSYWIEVLGIFPTEVRGTTFYQPLFYYVPVHNNSFCPLSPDVASEQYETESTEYCSTDSDTDFSSSSSDMYYTAEESESYFDPDEFKCEAEEFCYLNDTNLELINFEYSANNKLELSKEKECPSSESSKSNYEDEDYNDILMGNEANVKTRKSEWLPNYESNEDNDHFGSENSSSICDDMAYKDILSQIDNSFETEESKNLGDFNSKSYSKSQEFSSGNSAKRYDDIGFGDNTLSKNSAIYNSVKESFVDNVKDGKVDKHRPLSIRGIKERRDFSAKCSTNAFEFGDVNNRDRQNQGLKKCNTFEDLSGEEPKRYLTKIHNLENLSRFDENELYEKDLQCENSEIGRDDYECNRKSSSFDPDDFVFTEEEVKYMKDQIYLRALSGKLYQKTHIPSVAVLPTINEENEGFGEIVEEEADSEPSCLVEQQGHLNGSLCNLFDTSSENGESSGESQQKPKKKRMKRLREFLARIFCCVKPP